MKGKIWLSYTLILALFLLFNICPTSGQIYPLPSGGGVLIEPNVSSGIVVDDGGTASPYANNYRGSITLVPTPGNVLALTFTMVDLEDGFDFVAVYDGPNTTYPLLLCSISGSNLPPPIIQGTHPDGITIVLNSDGAANLSGFEADIISSPGGTSPNTDIISLPYLGNEVITSCDITVCDNGGAGCDYLNSSGVPIQDGTLTILPSLADHVVRIDFSMFEAEMLSSPPHPDGLRIYDGETTSDALIGDYSSNPGVITADNGIVPNESGAMTFYFYSDWGITREGFEGAVSCVPRPTATIITSDLTICNNGIATIEIELTGTPPFSFSYSDGNNTFDVTDYNGFLYSLDVSPPIGVTTYTLLKVGDANLPLRKVKNSSSVMVTVLSGPQASFNETKKSTCVGNTVKLEMIFKGVAPFSFDYTDGTNVYTLDNIMDNIYYIDVTPTVSTTYELLSVSDAECKSGTLVNKNVEVIITDPPTASISTAGSGYVCPGNPAKLKVDLTGVFPYSFEFTDGTTVYGPITTSQPVYYLNVSPSIPTTYTLVSVSSPSCPPGTVFGEAKIDFLTEPEASADYVLNCADGVATITASAKKGSSPYSYSFDEGSSFSSNNTANKLPSTTPYSVIVSDANGCKDTTSVLVQEITAPEITSITNITTTSMVVHWTNIPGSGISYNLRFRIYGSSTPWTTLPFINKNYKLVGGLQSGTTYEFEVQVNCKGDLSSPWSELDTATTLSPVPQTCDNAKPPFIPIPNGVYVTDIMPNSAKVVWNSVQGPGYVVSYGLSNVNPKKWPQFMVCNEDPFESQSSYFISGLTPGRTYRVRVRTNCTNCTTALKSTDLKSNWSITIQFDTPSSRLNNNDLANYSSDISLYPNPCSNFLNIKIPEISRGSLTEIKLYNQIGELVFQNKYSKEDENELIEMDIPYDLANGIYIIKLSSDDIHFQSKILIQK